MRELGLDPAADELILECQLELALAWFVAEVRDLDRVLRDRLEIGGGAILATVADSIIPTATEHAAALGGRIVVCMANLLQKTPRGFAAVWFRVKAYFRSWPFSY